MGSSRVIWNHEVHQANKIARSLVDASRIKLGWGILLFPNFLIHYMVYKKNLILTRKNLLFTKRMALDAAKEIEGGGSHAMQFRLVEVKTKKLLDKERKGYYTEKLRRKQLQEIELLIDHYLHLLNSKGKKYAEMIRTTYETRQKYLAFLNRLQRSEQEVIQAAIATMKKGSKQERLTWFGRVEEVSKEARLQEVEQIFPDV
ncbi:MAG: NF038143 family protein [Deltaproteobacteria bacterium]|nr:MAG: NF038143 family protein [Deltaproteobacteria bacterium]